MDSEDYEAAYNDGFDAGMLRAKEITWHFLTGQASAESAQGRMVKRDTPTFRHTLYLRDAVERFLKGMTK